MRACCLAGDRRRGASYARVVCQRDAQVKANSREAAINGQIAHAVIFNHPGFIFVHLVGQIAIGNVVRRVNLVTECVGCKGRKVCSIGGPGRGGVEVGRVRPEQLRSAMVGSTGSVDIHGASESGASSTTVGRVASVGVDIPHGLDALWGWSS